MEKHHESTNFFDLMILPHRALLTLIGLGENKFKNKIVRILYWIYFLCAVALQVTCLVWSLFELLDMAGVTCFQGTPFEVVGLNSVDMYTILGRLVIFYYRHLVTVIFLLWVTLFKKFSRVSRVLDEDENLSFVKSILHRKSRGQMMTMERRYIIISYTILILFLANVVAQDLRFYVMESVEDNLALLNSLLVRFIPNIVVTLYLAAACSVYLCNAAIWESYNQSIALDGSETSDRSVDEAIQLHARRYDSVCDFTEAVSDLYRWYNTVHVGSVAALVATAYESIYAAYPALIKVMCWIFELMHLSAFFFAATVYAASSASPRFLYKHYKRRTERREETVKNNDDASFHYFHHYVSHEWAPVSLDVAGAISISFTMVGVLIFTAINWIGVVMQFRQGASSSNSTGSEASCNDVMEYLTGANFTLRR